MASFYKLAKTLPSFRALSSLGDYSNMNIDRGSGLIARSKKCMLRKKQSSTVPHQSLYLQSLSLQLLAYHLQWKQPKKTIRNSKRFPFEMDCTDGELHRKSIRVY